MSGAVPAIVLMVLCEWELVTVVFAAGRERTATKTYVHRNPATGNYAIVRMVDGHLAGFLTLTAVEFQAFGAVA